MAVVEWDLTDAEPCDSCGDVHEPCIYGCGAITDDCYGGPCSRCEESPTPEADDG